MAASGSLDKDIETWKALSNDRPLKIVISGQGGIGKSSLINNFLDLEVGAKTAKRAKAVTKAVNQYPKVKNGVQVIIFDTPGLCDTEIPKEKTLEDIGKVTEGEVDLLYYCVNLRIGRLNEGDVDAFMLLSEIFGKELWENVVFVFTFANEECGSDDYFENIETLEEVTRDALVKKVHLTTNQAQSVSFTVAGNRDEYLHYHDGKTKNWKNDLFVKSLKKANPKAIPALLRIQMSEKEWSMIFAPKNQKEKELWWEEVGKYAGVVATGTGAAIGAVTLGAGTAVGVGVAVGGSAAGAWLGPVVGKWLCHKEVPELNAIVYLKYQIWKQQKK